MALSLGMDPLAYLQAGEVQGLLINEVLSQAAALIEEDRKRFAQNIGVAVSNALGQMFR